MLQQRRSTTKLVVIPYALTQTQSTLLIMDDMHNDTAFIQTTNFQVAVKIMTYVIMSNVEKCSLSNN